MKFCARLTWFFLLAGFVIVLPLFAVQTRVWQVGDFREFLKGRLTGVSISENGTLQLAPQAKVIFSPEDALALSLAVDRQHNLYVGTGHQGKVFHVTAEGKASLFFTAQEPDIFALALGPDGDLYVGSSPEGKIYRVTEDGKSSVFFDPNKKYIWALLFDSHGNLYVGTGDQGQIFRVDKTGKGSVFYDSAQTHIMCLAFDHDGNLLAGSVPDGLVYRIDPKGKAFVVYQADLPEVHALAVDGHGEIYVAALGGGSEKGVPMMLTPQTPNAPIQTEVMTVTADTSSDSSASAAQVGPKPEKPKPQPGKASPSFIHPGERSAAVNNLLKSQSRGALIKISPDSSVETLWSSNRESAYGLALLGKKVLFSTDASGQIFELDPSQSGENLTLLTETQESIATRLLAESGNLYITTSNVAKLFRMGTTPTGEGSYESPVKDTNVISHWGVLAWRGNIPSGSSVKFYTRSGNFSRPDQTWSDWAGPYLDPTGSQITSPPARYIQWKAVFQGSGSARPALDEVSVAFLNQNLPPEIHSFSISNAGERTNSNISPVSVMGAGGSFNVTTAAKVDSVQAGQEIAKAPITISWQADDSNGDSLVYSLYLKAADEKNWHLVKDKITLSSYTLDPSSFADGEYEARLIASDSPSNSPGTERESVMLSAPFWIDNTPPDIKTIDQTIRAGESVVRFRAEDPTSPLERAQYSEDGKQWQDIYSDDGIVDSRTETFTIRTRDLSAGEHVISLRAYDTAGNVGIGKAVVEVPKIGKGLQ